MQPYYCPLWDQPHPRPALPHVPLLKPCSPLALRHAPPSSGGRGPQAIQTMLPALRGASLARLVMWAMPCPNPCSMAPPPHSCSPFSTCHQQRSSGNVPGISSLPWLPSLGHLLAQIRSMSPVPSSSDPLDSCSEDLSVPVLPASHSLARQLGWGPQCCWSCFPTCCATLGCGWYSACIGDIITPTRK